MRQVPTYLPTYLPIKAGEKLGGWFFGPHNGYAQSVSRSVGGSVSKCCPQSSHCCCIMQSACGVFFWAREVLPQLSLSLGTEMGVAEKGRIIIRRRRRRRREDGAIFGLRGRL